MVNSARRTATAEKNRLALEELDKMLREQLAAGKNAEEKLMVDVDKDAFGCVRKAVQKP